MRRKRRPPKFTLVKPIRFAPDEWEKITKRAEEVVLPPSVYVRRTTLGYRLSRRINSRAIYQLSRIGNNLNQIARVANATGRVDVARRIDEVLSEVTNAIVRLAQR